MAKGHLVTDEDVPSSSPKKKSYDWLEYLPVPGAALAKVSVGFVTGLAQEIHKIETDSDYRERLAKTFNLVGNILLELIKSFTGITAIIYGIKAIQDAKNPEEKLVQTVSLLVTVLPGLGAGFKAVKTVPQVMGLLKMTNKMLQTGLGALEGAAKASGGGRRAIAELSKYQSKFAKLTSQLAHQIEERTGNLNDLKAHIEAAAAGLSGLAQTIADHDPKGQELELERHRLYNRLVGAYSLTAGRSDAYWRFQSYYDPRDRYENDLAELIIGGVKLVVGRMLPRNQSASALQATVANELERLRAHGQHGVHKVTEKIRKTIDLVLSKLPGVETQHVSANFPIGIYYNVLEQRLFRDHTWKDAYRQAIQNQLEPELS